MDPDTLFTAIEEIILASAEETTLSLGFGRATDRKRYASGLAAGINSRLQEQGLTDLTAETEWPVSVKVGGREIEDKSFPVVIALVVSKPGASVEAVGDSLPPEQHQFPLLPLDITTARKNPFSPAAVQAAIARARALGAPTVGIVNFGLAQPRVWYHHQAPIRHIIPRQNTFVQPSKTLPSTGKSVPVPPKASRTPTMLGPQIDIDVEI